MKKLLLLLFTFSVLLGIKKYSSTLNIQAPSNNKITKGQRIQGAIDEEFKRTKDLTLGYPPTEELIYALEETKRMQTQQLQLQRSLITNAKWRERGPSNIGGRTRTILIDKSDPTGNTIWAGGVGGGLWKTNDISVTSPQWENVNDFLENLAIGAMAQDPNNHAIMYLGTGEGFPNSDAIRGIGIFKSTDGGENWDLLSSTNNSTFRLTRSLMIHPVTGDVYAATTNGLWRSTDQGDSWQKVLSVIGFSANDIYDVEYASNGIIYASGAGSVFRSPSGDQGDWISLSASASGFPSGWGRVEMTVCELDPDRLYIIGNVGGGASNVYTSGDGGNTWQQRTMPGINGNEFTNGQAWYDLDIAVNPFNPLHVVVGGVPIMFSNDGGLSFSRFAQNMHVDQHKILFDKDRENVIYFGNDGGIWRSITGTSQQVENKNTGYNVTQFYGCAIHPEEGSTYYIGGTQDNNSLQLHGLGISTGRSVKGGDGFLCHIDEDEPNIQMVSSQFGSYALSTDGGLNFSGGAELNGGFLNPSDYDSDANIMYAQTNDGDYVRWNVNNGQTEVVDISGQNPNVSTVAVDPNTEDRVYFGTFSGSVIRVENANVGNPVQGASVSPSGGGTISSIYIENGNADHLLVTKSNYGSQSVFESKDGGDSWTNVEGNLPNMPVRWGIFSPKDPTQAMIATEAGVWTTELLDGGNTQWIPPVEGRGIPLVRVDMLQLRKSDNIVLAATHGRGLFTTDVFAEAKAKMFIDQVGYLDVPLDFSGELSLAADEYLWDFGDGNSSTEETITHSYPQIGSYPISLTINQTLIDYDTLKVLPSVSTPYEEGVPNYGGDFEGEVQQYGVETFKGSSFERGNSTMAGKSGTHSGDNAFVVGLNEIYYEHGTRTNLYLPNFNMQEEGIYEFSFWAEYRLSSGKDGFRVEYSTNKGASWKQLGSVDDPNWYNTKNTNLDNSSFPRGASYFSGQKLAYVQYKLNISDLAGNENVAFRFVFKGGSSGNYRGLAIDDVSISKYEGELKTQVFDFSGSYSKPNEIKVTWNTQPEYNCKRFELYRSTNGVAFEKIENIPAKGKTTTDLNSYSQAVVAQRRIYFFKLKVFNENEVADYTYEFETPIIVVKKDKDEEIKAFNPFPNPFFDKINMTFNDNVQEPMVYELFNTAGQLVTKGQIDVPGIFATIDVGGGIPAGIYFLQIRIGEGEAQIFKLFGGI